MKLGFDFGSRNIHFVALDGASILQQKTFTHHGNIPGVLVPLINEVLDQYGPSAIESFGVTGNGVPDGLRSLDPVLATIKANQFLATGCENILSIGCESFYLVFLDAQLNYVDHSLNTDCASGTGSFIDQQAKRLGYTTEDFSREAHAFVGKSPGIATRCAVFAKSDIIHAQAEGFSKEAIAAGICEGVVRSILANVVKGRRLSGKLLLIGGVSQNQKLVAEFAKHLECQVVVLPGSPAFNAVGAAVEGQDTDLNILRDWTRFAVQRETREKLEIRLTQYPDFHQDRTYKEDGIEVAVYRDPVVAVAQGFLGIDVGSTSSKVILLDEDKNILLGLYTSTAGDPVTAVSHLLKKLKTVFGHTTLCIKGVATTGSGRHLIGAVIGADLAVNEITAHAKGATFLDPEVDTIIEIGGQDSKFTLLKKGSVAHSVMNYVCAAGTGSFIEEQAKKLGIELSEVSEMGLGQEAPLTSDRCTVYMERDLNLFLAEGWKKEQLIASVLFSVRDNYLAKVAGRTLFGNRVYFQGATARNKALVAAFENEIGKPISVSKYCHLTGALGAALIVIDRRLATSRFRGVDFHCLRETETCRLCHNHCNMTVYTVNEGKVAWGLKCGRDYEEQKVGTRLDPVSRLEKKYNAHFELPSPARRDAPTIGIPDTIFMKEYTALFQDFFLRLGFNVTVEKNSGPKMSRGKEIAYSEFCAPLLLAHGLVRSLVEKGVDHIFFPTIINEQGSLERKPAEEHFLKKDLDSYYCYYSAYAPTIVDNLLTLDLGRKMISPRIKFNNRPLLQVAEELAAALADIVPASKETIVETFLSAHQQFRKKEDEWRRGSDGLLKKDTDKVNILLLGRPYVVFDPTLNKGIPAKIEDLGFELIHQSMLDLSGGPGPGASRYLDRMHWYYGQQILLAAEVAVQQEHVYPVLLTSFRCSPDAYVVTYFKEMMEAAGKPYLIVQLDEHSSDVGYQTRIEAGIESFMNDFEHRSGRRVSCPGPARRDAVYETRISPTDTVYFPYLSPVLDEILYAAFAAHGYTAKGLPLDRKIMNLGYKYVSGGECLPNVAVVGSVIDAFQKKDFDPASSVLYLGDSCLSCNFHQYTSLIRAACQKAGIEGVRIYSPKLGMPRSALPLRLSLDISAGCVLGSLLYKLYYRFHPYETERGATRIALERSQQIIKQYLGKKLPLWEIPLHLLGAGMSELYFNYFMKEDGAGPPAGKEPPPDDPRAHEAADRLKEFLHPSKHMLAAAREIRVLFENIPVAGRRKPRIGLLGDLYVKYNPVLNEDIYQFIEDLGGEVLLPSYMETGAHLLDASVRESGASRVPLIKLTMYEKSFEHVFKGLLDDCFEPPVEETVDLLHQHGFKHFIPGETTINVCRLLYYVKHRLVDAVVHINPVLCCPGTVTSSIYRKLQKDLQIPIVDVYYDGINKPNKVIIPQMSKLMQDVAASQAERQKACPA